MTILENIENFLKEHNDTVRRKKLNKAAKKSDEKYSSTYAFFGKDDKIKIPIFKMIKTSLVIKQHNENEISIIKSRFFKTGTYVLKSSITKGEDK